MPDTNQTGLAIVQNATAVALSGGFTLTPIGCSVEGEPTIEEYGSALERCGRLANATHWALGDLIIYGEGRGDWGETYSQFVDLTSRSYATISQSARVSKAFPPGEMRACADRISWSHHREALRAPEDARLRLLKSACEYDWTREELRMAITDLLVELSPPVIDVDADADRVDNPQASDESPDPTLRLTVQCASAADLSNLIEWCRQYPTSFQITRG